MSCNEDEQHPTTPVKVKGLAKSQFDFYVSSIDEFTHVGDIESRQVLCNLIDADEVYIITEEQVPIAFFYIKRPAPHVAEIINMHVLPEKRSTCIAGGFMMFIKRHENACLTILADVESEDDIEFVNRIYGRFYTFWNKDGQRVPFEPSTLAKHYAEGWTLTLEHYGDFSGWERFYSSTRMTLNNIYEVYYADHNGKFL